MLECLCQWILSRTTDDLLTHAAAAGVCTQTHCFESIDAMIPMHAPPQADYSYAVLLASVATWMVASAWCGYYPAACADHRIR